MEVTDKRALITGGANGIGRELALVLCQKGAAVGVLDKNESSLRTMKDENPGLYVRACNVADYRQTEAAVNDFCETQGPVDILVNNAGLIHNSLLLSLSKGKLVMYDKEIWDAVISTNLNGVFYMTSHAVRKMVEQRRRGLIINISSICAAGNLGQSAYSASKAAVNALTVTWAKELGPFGIRVAGVAPGFTRTDTTINSMSESVLNDWKSKTPSRRIADPLEIVEGILFIIRNDFFNGRILELDGGLRL